jgi:hypothetical protein
MESIKHITDHLLNNYKFEVIPPGLPVDKFNYYKMNLYLKLNTKVFRFLNKYFPVKYNKERLDKSIWFMRGDVEISIEPTTIESSIYVKFLTGSKINPNTNVFIMMLYHNPPELLILSNTRIINSQSNIVDLDNFLCKVPELLNIKRDFILSKLLS